MSAEFIKLTQYLKQRRVPLQEYHDYLQYAFSSGFTSLSQHLKQQKVDLKEYQKYLSQNSMPLNKSTEKRTKIDPNNTLMLKKLGFKLLSESKVDISELNSIFQELSKKEEINPKILLNKLLQTRRLKIDEFVEYTRGNWTEIQEHSLPYRLKSSPDGLEFYLTQQMGNKEQLERKNIGHYHVLEELGRGAMGVVYKAYHPKLNQMFALKMLTSDAFVTEKQLQRFAREIKTMAKLEHPNIIQIIDSGEDNGRPYLVMELIHGDTLAKKMEVLSVREVIGLTKKTLEALHYAHQQGIVHRDLKPENIFVTSEGEPKIGDFGLAKDLQDKDSLKLTQSGAVLGTAHYMSPEQALGGNKPIDSRSDIYSIGICLYRILTKEFPYNAQTINALFEKILYKEPAAPSKLNSGIHRDLDVILLKALEKEASKRYQTAADFANDLGRFLKGYPLQAKAASKLGKLKKWRKRNRQKISFIGIGMMTFFLLLGYFQWEKYHYKKLGFDAAYQKAIQEREVAKAIKGQSFAEKARKLKHLLRAFNSLNTALSIKEEDPRSEKEKWDIGIDLILLTCKNEEYQLASYVVREISFLQVVDKSEKDILKNLVQKEQNKILRKQLAQLEGWIKRLKSDEQSKEIREDMIFAISKMKKEPIFKKLISLLDEGTKYILDSSAREKKLDQFYGTVVTALGRLENPNAAEPLYQALKKLEKKLVKMPEGIRPFNDLKYMILVARALGNLKDPQYSKKISEVRFNMGENAIFWEGTLRTSMKLLQLLNLKNFSPNDFDSYAQRAKLKFMVRDFKAALEDYDEAIRLNPNFIEGYNSRGNCKRELGDNEGAMIDYDFAISLEPNSPFAYNNRAIIKQELEDNEGAIEDYNKALQLDPKFIEIYNNRGLLKKLTGNLKGALEDFDEALRINPQYSMVYGNRGYAKRDMGDFEGAISDFSEAIRLAPRFSGYYVGRGGTKFKLGDLKNALKDFNTAIRLDPKNSVAYCKRGIIRENKNDFEGAMRDYDEAILIKASYDYALYRRGTLKRKMGKFKSALADLNESIHLEADYAYSFYQRGLLKRTLGNKQGAIDDLTEAIRINPNDEGFYIHRGLAKKDKREFNSAIDDFEQALLIKPDYASAYNHRGIVRELKKDFKGAISDFGKAIRLDPTFSSPYINRAQIFTDQRDYEKAKKDLRHYLRLTKGDKDFSIQRNREEILKAFPDLRD